ncbi:MAG: hypothetical protein WCK77_02610 [Verrucomicrobiota bacterium]
MALLSRLIQLACFALHVGAADAAEPPGPIIGKVEPGTRAQGQAHVTLLTAQPWLSDWKGSRLEEIRLVEQKPDQTWPTGLPPAWWAKVVGPRGGTGYLAWDSTGSGRLLEFAFDAPLAVATPSAKVLAGVPALQQFPIPQIGGPPIASGCVPTAGASVLGFWIAHGQPQWRGDAGTHLLQDFARRLRSRLKMEPVPDRDGYTEDGLTLAGAMPQDLARAIQVDADAHQVPLASQWHRFNFDTLKSEIEAGRPCVASCTVRLPHKPHLSWGHEVAAVGWMQLDGSAFVGVSDNFYPTRTPDAVRWICASAFNSLITVRPATAGATKESITTAPSPLGISGE